MIQWGMYFVAHFLISLRNALPSRCFLINSPDSHIASSTSSSSLIDNDSRVKPSFFGHDLQFSRRHSSNGFSHRQSVLTSSRLKCFPPAFDNAAKHRVKFAQ
uniref:Putative secreted protein n=1 Tax=Ixodes ricinus TaxID=34613 RepID=A0A6B0UFA3_IXORI